MMRPHFVYDYHRATAACAGEHSRLRVSRGCVSMRVKGMRVKGACQGDVSRGRGFDNVSRGFVSMSCQGDVSCNFGKKLLSLFPDLGVLRHAGSNPDVRHPQLVVIEQQTA